MHLSVQILTAHLKEQASSNDLVYYAKSNQGPVKLIFKDQGHIFFIESQEKFSPQGILFERKPTKLMNFSRQKVDAIYLKKYRDLREVKDYCERNKLRTFELDVPPTERFLMERFIYGQCEVQGEAITHNNMIEFVNPSIRACNDSIALSSLSLDIETGQNNELYSIGLYFKFKDHIKEKVLMIGPTHESNSSLLFYESQADLIRSFLKLLQAWDPDFIIGWHVIGFDLMFLERKCHEFGIDFNLGRENLGITLEEKKGVGFVAQTFGRVILDGPPIMRASFFKFKNFKLETVASEILGTGKDIDSDSGKVAEIERRFKEDKKALAKYNLLDCKLVTDIFEKCQIFNLLIKRSNVSGLLIDRLSISTAAFDHVMLPYLHRKGFVAPNRFEIDRETPASGGYVIAPESGLYKNIALFDFKSLYPTIIQTFHIDPYSKLCSENNTIKTPGGLEFSKDEYILPDVIESLKKKRSLAKHNNERELSQAIKILMNSFYGVMGSSRSRFYHADLPQAITTTGKYILEVAINFFKEKGFKTIYGDTDSLFVELSSHDSVFAKDLCHQLNIFLGSHLKETFGVDSHLECEFEAFYEKMFFPKLRSSTQGAKKKYVGLINSNVIFKGMESIRSDSTELSKDFQHKLFERFFKQGELETFIKDYISNLKAGFFDDYLVYTKRLSKPVEEYKKNIPPHVKAAMKINHQGPYRLKEVSYVYTRQGVEPINNNPKSFDYEHYIEKQLKPVADDILIYQGSSFEALITGSQLSFNL